MEVPHLRLRAACMAEVRLLRLAVRIPVVDTVAAVAAVTVEEAIAEVDAVVQDLAVVPVAVVVEVTPAAVADAKMLNIRNESC